MDIIDNRPAQIRPLFKDVIVGNCFMRDGKYYMRISDEQTFSGTQLHSTLTGGPSSAMTVRFRAVDLSGGTLKYFTESDEVIPIKVKLLVES